MDNVINESPVETQTQDKHNTHTSIRFFILNICILTKPTCKARTAHLQTRVFVSE